MDSVIAVPRHEVNTFEMADMIAFIISVLLIGKDYNRMNDSFFMTTFILILSPMLRKFDFYFFGGNNSINKNFYKFTNILELSIMVFIVIICILGIINVVHVCNSEIDHAVYIRVVEDYVFFSGKGFDLRLLIGSIFVVMGLKLFNSISCGFLIKK